MRIAQPLYESADGLGVGAPSEAAPPVESESLSDHEASYSPEAQRAPAATDDDAPAAERDETGKFKPRHRATSQRADADDVAAINAQTKRIKDAEAKLGADIARLDGESDRVYTLRRRAELLERQSTAPKATATAPTSTAAPHPAQRPSPQPVPATFPTLDEFLAIPGIELVQGQEYEQWQEARTRWMYAVLRQEERQQEAREREQQTQAERTARYTSALPAARAKYADFDTVVRPDLMVNAAIGHAILASEHGPEIAYILAKNDTLRNELNADITDFSPAAVAATRRYLDTLVAGQRPTPPPSRTAAGSTGAALALAQPPAPRPPTPVRTGSIQAADTPPDDNDMSLASHERHFGGRRRN